MNSYLKALSQIYFNYELNDERKDVITYLYLLYSNDHMPEDF
jgi:hypothetical protein